MTTPYSFSIRALLRDTIAIVALSFVVAVVVNLFRHPPMRWFQGEAYEVLVPCPEPTGDATEVTAESGEVLDPKTLLIDARGSEEFAAWHAQGARNQPFDWLGPPADEAVKVLAREVAKTGARRVLVYGDGGDPDSGREWARILSGAHLKNVLYVRGGAPAIRQVVSGPKEGR